MDDETNFYTQNSELLKIMCGLVSKITELTEES